MWDGESTYDPATGCVDLGRFTGGDGAAHWRLHTPGARACGGDITGLPGTGKTACLHVLAAEAGAATVTGAGGRLGPQRICAVIMCDPQMQPFGVWRGHADLTAWGPAACLHALRILAAAGRERATEMGGSAVDCFDPAPGRPLLQAFVDDWPALRASRYGAEAADLAGAIRRYGPKTGVAVVRADAELTRTPDAADSNTVAYRAHEFGPGQDITGYARRLPAGVPGLGHILACDRRPQTPFQTKYLPEYTSSGGVTVRDLAVRVAAAPVTFDEPVARVLARAGVMGRGQVIDDLAGYHH